MTGLAPGKTHVVQCCTNLSGGNWFPVFTNTAAGGVTTVTNAWTGQTRLYRIHQLP